MQTCPKCRAHVGAGMTWCGQCFTSLAATDAASDGPRLSPWERSRAEPSVEVAPEFSRWKGGPTHFGPVGRILMSIGLMLGLLVGYPWLRGLIFAVGGVVVPGTGFLIMYVAVALPAGLFVFGKIWKRVRVA